MRCLKEVKEDQEIVNRVITRREKILQDVETVPPIGEIRHRGGVELILQEPLAQNVMAGNTYKGLHSARARNLEPGPVLNATAWGTS